MSTSIRLLNAAASAVLIATGIVCVAGQISNTLGWVRVGRGELSLEVCAEGWLLQWNSGGAASAIRPATIGIVPEWTRGSNSVQWDESLADSAPQQPFPGLLLAQGLAFNIVALRHGLVMSLAFAIKLSTHVLDTKMRRFAERVVEGSAEAKREDG